MKTNNPLKVVRLGSGVGDAVRDVQLEQLVDKALNPNQGDELESLKSQDVTLNAIQAELNAVTDETKLVDDALETTRDNAERTVALRKQQQQLRTRRYEIRERLNALKDDRRKERNDMNQARRKAQFEVLQDAQVICTTLSGAGHSTLQDAQLDFDVIIIDEAAQAIELSTLVPLKFTCKRCILVGDPNQLPPTVMSGQVRIVYCYLTRTQSCRPRNNCTTSPFSYAYRNSSLTLSIYLAYSIACTQRSAFYRANSSTEDD